MGLRETSAKNVKVGSKWKFLSERKPGHMHRSDNPNYVVTRITTRHIHFDDNTGYDDNMAPGQFVKELIPVRGVEPEIFAQIKSLICQLALKPVDRIKLLEELVRSDI